MFEDFDSPLWEQIGSPLTQLLFNAATGFEGTRISQKITFPSSLKSKIGTEIQLLVPRNQRNIAISWTPMTFNRLFVCNLRTSQDIIGSNRVKAKTQMRKRSRIRSKTCGCFIGESHRIIPKTPLRWRSPKTSSLGSQVAWTCYEKLISFTGEWDKGMAKNKNVGLKLCRFEKYFFRPKRNS